MDNNESILYNTNASLLTTILFFGMILFMLLGSFIGRRLRRTPEGENNSINTTILTAVLGLFAFLLGFSFSMSGSRYENRRSNSIYEANAISTAISRADLYPDSERLAFRKDFKEYLLARIDYFKAGNNQTKMNEAERQTQSCASHIWNRATANASHATGLTQEFLMIPALNDMNDKANFNNHIEKFRVPDLIIILLIAISIICAFFMGYSSISLGRFNDIFMVGFCLLSCLVIYTTLDLDRSRSGLIAPQTSLQSLTELLPQFDK